MSASYLSYPELLIVKLNNLLPQPSIDLSIFGSRRPMVFDYIVLDSIHAIAVEQESPKFASHTSTHQPQKRTMNILPPVPCPHVDRFLIPHSLKIAQLYHRINFYGIELPPARFVFFNSSPLIVFLSTISTPSPVAADFDAGETLPRL